jgi:hypothetical protein
MQKSRGGFFSAMERKPKLPAMHAKVTALGQSLVNPWLNFIPTAHPTSNKPAIREERAVGQLLRVQAVRVPKAEDRTRVGKMAKALKRKFSQPPIWFPD